MKPYIPWLQIDKATLSDPRLLAAAQKLIDRVHGTSSGHPADVFVTSAVRGALVMLWAYAHDHIQAGDILPLTPRTIDSMVGIDGFCDCLPSDWLQVIDDGKAVKLPHFIDKNKIVKIRQQREKDAKRHRQNRAIKRPTDIQGTSNGHPRDVQRISECENGEVEKKEKLAKASQKKGARLPEVWALPDDWRQWAVSKGLTSAEATEQGERFADYWRAAPGENGRKADWPATWRNWVRRALENRERARSGTGLARPTRLTQESAQAAIDAAYGSSDESTYVVGNDERIKYDG